MIDMMRRILTGPVILGFAVVAVLALPAVCPAPAARFAFASEQKAGPEAAIWRDVQEYLKRGEELKACKAAVGLKKYSDTPTYERAKKVMERYGYSLQDPLGGYTIKQIIKLQNILEPVRQRDGKMPTVGKRKSHLDAWGTPLRVEMVARGSYIYIIRSAGPDRRYITDDDYIIGVRGSHSIKKSKVESMEDSSRKKGRTGLLRGRDDGKGEDGIQKSPVPSAAKPLGKGNQDEYQVDLNDLLNKK